MALVNGVVIGIVTAVGGRPGEGSTSRGLTRGMRPTGSASPP